MAVHLFAPKFILHRLVRNGAEYIQITTVWLLCHFNPSEVHSQCKCVLNQLIHSIIHCIDLKSTFCQFPILFPDMIFDNMYDQSLYFPKGRPPYIIFRQWLWLVRYQTFPPCWPINFVIFFNIGKHLVEVLPFSGNVLIL